MDDLKNLYFRIENPINNRIKWNKILSLYSTSLNYENFYNQITYKDDSNNIVTYNQKDKEEFYLYMWSIWFRKIKTLSDDDIRDLIEKKIFDYDIYDTISELDNLETVDSYTKIMKVLTSSNINKYFSNFFDDFNHKIVVYSDFNIKNDASYNTVLTIKIDSDFLYKILSTYVNKCIKSHIPYYFKYSEYTDDIVVSIYSTIDNLCLNVKILEDIKNEYNLYFYDNYDLLLGSINEAITIRNKDYYNSYQYYKERSLILFKSLDSVIYEYLLNHLDLKVSYKDKKLDVLDYLATSVMEIVVNDLVEKSVRSTSEYFSVANSQDLINFKKYIKDRLLSNMKQILNDRLYLKLNNEKITIVLNKYKNLKIEVDVIMSCIRGLTQVLISIDNNLVEAFKTRIKNECQFFKVDYEKFCLDIGFAKKIMFNREKYRNYKKEIERIHDEITRSGAFDNLNSYRFGQISNREPISDSKESIEIEEDN